MTLSSEHADVFVRPAVAGDDAAITRVQLRAWRAGHADVLGAQTLENLDVATVHRQWATAITSPPSPGHRVLVACDGPQVVGFAASVPADDGADVIALEVDPDRQRGGHGSRLLTACVDLARAEGATHVRTWVLDGDAGRERFLTACGLCPDGGRRELAVGAGTDPPTVTERRWAAEI